MSTSLFRRRRVIGLLSFYAYLEDQCTFVLLETLRAPRDDDRCFLALTLEGLSLMWIDSIFSVGCDRSELTDRHVTNFCPSSNPRATLSGT